MGNSRFTTFDAPTAAFLSMKGHQVIYVNDDGKIAFAFDSTPELQADFDVYLAGGEIPALAFSAKIRQIKEAMHREKDRIS